MQGLFILFIVVVVIQLFYLLLIFSRLAFYNEPAYAQKLPSISVVICARNESARLQKNLPLILEQDYPSFEVVLVNDNSDDDTELLLQRFSSQYPRLVVRHIVQDSNIMKGKKYPLTIGIRAATHDYVLLTDADCIPSSDKWIYRMAAAFNEKKQIVLGYAPFKKHPDFLNKFIRYETFMTALQYLSYAIAGVPYMGVGRNMAYGKKFFFANNVFPKHPHLVSGDDDLLINKAASGRNTTVQVSKESFMYSEPKKSWNEYWEQKRRHLSTGKYYKFGHQLLLAVFSVSQLLFYIAFILLIVYTNYQLAAVLLFALRMFIQGIIFFRCMKKLDEQDLFWYFPLMDILFVFYFVKLFPDLFQTKSTEWK